MQIGFEWFERRALSELVSHIIVLVREQTWADQNFVRRFTRFKLATSTTAPTYSGAPRVSFPIFPESRKVFFSDCLLSWSFDVRFVEPSVDWSDCSQGPRIVVHRRSLRRVTVSMPKRFDEYRC